MNIDIDRILTKVLERRKHAAGARGVVALLTQAMQDTEKDIRGLFPGFRTLDWLSIRRAVSDEIDYLAQESGTFPFSAGPAKRAEYVIVDGDRSVQVEVNINHTWIRGKFARPYLGDMQAIECTVNLLPVHYARLLLRTAS